MRRSVLAPCTPKNKQMWIQPLFSIIDTELQDITLHGLGPSFVKFARFSCICVGSFGVPFHLPSKNMHEAHWVEGTEDESMKLIETD